MRSVLFYLVIILVTTISCQLELKAEDFPTLQSKYLALRNTDTLVKERARWESLSKRFEEFAKKNLRAKEAGQALFNAAIIHEQLYQASKDRKYIDRSIQLYETIPRDFPGNDFADDALLKVGDIYSNLLDNKDEAERRYREIVEAYPNSDMLIVADARLKRTQEHSRDLSPDSRRAVLNKDLPLIVIDPGHGGEDHGAVGKDGLMEKDIVLDVAIKLNEISKKEGVYNIKLTRSSDVFVPLKNRTNYANDFDAELFLSLHVNSYPNGKVTGIETYYLDNTNDKSSQRLADRENQYFSEREGLQDLNFMLSDLIQNAKLGNSIVLANVIQKQLIDTMSTQWGKQHNLGVKTAPFYVLVGVHVPCALVEMYFVNNIQDEKNLARSALRQSLAEGLNQGIKEYILRGS